MQINATMKSNASRLVNSVMTHHLLKLELECSNAHYSYVSHIIPRTFDIYHMNHIVFLLLLNNQDHTVPDVTMDSHCKYTPIFSRNCGLWSILENKLFQRCTYWYLRCTYTTTQEMTRSHILPLLGQIHWTLKWIKKTLWNVLLASFVTQRSEISNGPCK